MNKHVSYLFIIPLLLSSALIGKEIFESTDDSGLKKFSDRPNIHTAQKNKKQILGKIFIPLKKDTSSPTKKLEKLQGQWQQINIKPTLEDMRNLLITTRGKNGINKLKDALAHSVVTVRGNRITVENKPQKNSVHDNTDKIKNLGIYHGKLDFYNGTPLELDGFWSFESSPNPFVAAFLSLIAPHIEKKRRTEQVRFDIKGNKMMVTVALPDDLQVNVLNILYKKK